MMTKRVSIDVIGYVSSCFTEKFGTPRQCGLVPSAEARIRLVPPFNRKEMVRGLEEFSHLWVHFLFHQASSDGWKATVRPPRLGGSARKGVWATRSPHRPNFMGLSAVQLKGIELGTGVELIVAGVDLMDGTPVLDLKPYLPSSDCIEEATEGWAETAFEPLGVQFSPAAAQFCSAYEEETATPLQRLIREILSQDPRPASQRGRKEGYGMRLHDVNVRWRVSAATCLVLSCERLS